MARKAPESNEPPFDVEGETTDEVLERLEEKLDAEPKKPLQVQPSNGCLSRGNEDKLEAAIQYIRKLFHDAAGPQVGGRKFFGRVTMATVWQKGECVEIQPCIEGKDRVIREGM